MKIYLAGGTHTLLPIFLEDYKFMRILDSFWSYQKGEKAPWWAQDFPDGRKAEIFLDSGAFSAWESDKVISMDSYLKFIDKYKKWIHQYAVLDVIGDAAKTLDAQKEMERNGFKPIACFHAYEPPEYLKYYVEHQEYLAFGGELGTSGRSRSIVKWLDEVWHKYVLDSGGQPRIKMHGFGLTSVPLMKRFPWYSVDSATWVLIAGYGSIYAWLPGNHMEQVFVSEVSGTRRDKGKHYDTLSKEEQKVLDTYFSQHNSSYETLSKTYKERARMNVVFFKLFEENYIPVTKLPSPQGFFI